MMETRKKHRLEKKGWRIGSAQDFLGSSDEEAQYIEMHLALASLLGRRREHLGLTQTRVAELVGSSQSRVAKMEAGDPTVSMDLLIRSLLALRVTRGELAEAIGEPGARRIA